MKKRSIRRRPRVILSVDVGGSHVKVMTNTKKLKREFVSGSDLSARDMVKKVAELTEDWSSDVVSVGYPGPVVRDRPTTQPYILGTGWKGFDFAKAFGRPTKVVNDALTRMRLKRSASVAARRRLGGRRSA
jgi:polyphosphate glucokinase